MNREEVRVWLQGYAWAEDTQEEKDAVIECILSQDDWKYISTRADQFDDAWADSGEEQDVSGEEFALSSLYECHDGPHLATCPSKHD